MIDKILAQLLANLTVYVNFTSCYNTTRKLLITPCFCIQGLVSAQKDAENKELLAKLHQERMDTTFQRDMLQYLIADKVDIDFDEAVLTSRDNGGFDRVFFWLILHLKNI